MKASIMKKTRLNNSSDQISGYVGNMQRSYKLLGRWIFILKALHPNNIDSPLLGCSSGPQLI